MLPLLPAVPRSESPHERNDAADLLWTARGTTSIISLSLPVSIPTSTPTPASETNRVLKYPLGCCVRDRLQLHQFNRIYCFALLCFAFICFAWVKMLFKNRSGHTMLWVIRSYRH
jgi:hypothetical protein